MYYCIYTYCIPWVWIKCSNRSVSVIFGRFSNLLIVLSAYVHCFDSSCYPLAFGVPAALMIVSTRKSAEHFLLECVHVQSSIWSYRATTSLIVKLTCLGKTIKLHCNAILYMNVITLRMTAKRFWVCTISIRLMLWMIFRYPSVRKSSIKIIFNNTCLVHLFFSCLLLRPQSVPRSYPDWKHSLTDGEMLLGRHTPSRIEALSFVTIHWMSSHSPDTTHLSVVIS